MHKLIIIGFLGTLFLASCGPKKEENAVEQSKNEEMTTVNQWPNGVCYEIFIQSFADSNGDGIGDISGATQKLDYLQDLGVRAVWLMPIMPSPSYHKYDVVDYYDIHPDYGTMDDFKTFVKEAHKRNIDVVIDMIINHTSSEHPWFKKAASSKDSPFREYYVWADRDSIADQIAKEEVTQDSGNITQWHTVDGDEEAEHYYGFFYGGMPDLNFDSEKVREEIINIGEFWLSEVGVDGFRLDAAKHIYPDDRVKDSYEWWQTYRDAMREIKPDVYLVGEVWASSEVVKEFVKGLPALFNFDLAGSINQSVINERNTASTIEGPEWKEVEGETIIDRLVEQRETFSSYSEDYKDAIFLSNHDQNRVMSNLKADDAKAKLAASILFTLPGSPYIYYGEEIGMLGKKPDEHIREPFLWSNKDEDTVRATWITPRFSTDKKVKSLAEQMADSESLYNHYKEMITLRNNSDLLTNGEIVAIDVDNPGVLAYARVLEEEGVTIFHNLTSKAILVALNDENGIYSKSYRAENGDSLTIAPYKTVIIE